MLTKKWSQNILIVHCATSWKWMKHFFILSPSFHCRKWGFPECYKIKGEMCSIGEKNKKKDKKKCYLAQHHINCREMFIFLIKLVRNDKQQHFLDTVSSRLPQGQMQEICDTLCNSVGQCSRSVQQIIICSLVLTCYFNLALSLHFTLFALWATWMLSISCFYLI